MKTIATEYDFRNAFQRMDRSEDFSYDGLRALFEYLEQYEEACLGWFRDNTQVIEFKGGIIVQGF